MVFTGTDFPSIFSGRHGRTNDPFPATENFRVNQQILDDAPVWRLEPFSHIGDVERVLIDQETDEIVALVIRRGVLFHHEVVVPIDYVTEVLDGFINVRIGDKELEKLEAYHPPDEGR